MSLIYIRSLRELGEFYEYLVSNLGEWEELHQQIPQGLVIIGLIIYEKPFSISKSYQKEGIFMESIIFLGETEQNWEDKG
jgi:hypothetical protein